MLQKIIKIAVFLILVIFFTGNRLEAQTQDSTMHYRNAIKLNILSPFVFKSTMLQYERMVKDNFSLSIGAGLKLKGNLPSLYENDDLGLTVMNSGLTGYYFNIEGRFYPRKCNCESKLGGFYVAPYLRFNRFKLNATGDFVEADNSISSNSFKAGLVEYGVGAVMGYQMFLSDRLMVDFIFFGPRTSRFRLKVDFEQEVSEEFLDAISENINNTLDRVLQKGGVDLTSTELGLKSNFNWLAFRYAINVGYAF